MNIITKIRSFISSFGENPNFIAFMAHTGATNFVASHWGKNALVVWAVVLVCVAKEFWFDLKFESNPPQKLHDSALDFAGYMTGMGIGLMTAYNVWSMIKF